MAEEQIGPSEILKSAGADQPVVEGTFLQRTGLVLATFVGLTAVLITLALILRWFWCMPPVPVIPPGTDEAKVKTIIETYKALQQAALEPFTTLFDSIVVKVLLPVFTSILGYIFGSQGRKSDD